MTAFTRLLSSVLLASGLVLVFTGLSHALAFSIPGMLASVAAIAALLYAGGVWFGAPPAIAAPAGTSTVLVFDRALRIVAGPATGTSVVHQFPSPLRPEIDTRCRAALRGECTQFTCIVEHRPLLLDIGPVASASGPILYGVLVAGAGPPAPVLTEAVATSS